jgi:hypothetical protein
MVITSSQNNIRKKQANFVAENSVQETHNRMEETTLIVAMANHEEIKYLLIIRMDNKIIKYFLKLS